MPAIVHSFIITYTIARKRGVMQWRTKEEAYQRTMLDWSWITDSLLSNLYAAHALSVHLSVKSPTSAHSRHHGSPTSLQTVLKESGRTVRCGHMSWSGYRRRTSRKPSSFTCTWDDVIKGEESYNTCSPPSCFDCIMNKLNKLIEWQTNKNEGTMGRSGVGLMCTV